jgi:beta-glucosidase
MRGVRRPRRVAVAGICLAMLTALAAATGWVMLTRPRPAPALPPWMNAALAPRARAELLLAQMTLEEKVGQMTQAERGAVSDDPGLITTWRLGSLLSGANSPPTPNTPEVWADMVDAFQARALQTRLQIPLIYGVDAVHGHGNLVGATVFPHNIGLGPRATPTWCGPSSTSPPRRPERPAPSGCSRPASAWPATCAGAGPMRASARTPPWSSR